MRHAQTFILLGSLAIGACQGSSNLPDQAFLAIDRNAADVDTLVAAEEADKPKTTAAPTSGSAGVITDNTESSFYVAINKKELGNRWFLSAYLKQVFPYAVAGGAGRSLGTSVVTFRVQNDKLFVFRADDNIKDSDTFNPQVIIDAYPLVTNHKGFTAANGYKDYVLFDPAAGQNSLGLAGEAFGAGGYTFKTELQFMQRYRAIDDGITFEMVFSGFSDQADPGAYVAGEPNAFRTSGTLGVGLRRYSEGTDFKPARAVNKPFYFAGDLNIIPNTGMIAVRGAKWNIKPGMKPIRWVISDQFLQYKNDPDLKDLDVVGAMKAGIENWNAVFGFQALVAEVGTVNDSYADDDTNYLIHDGNPSYGAAFANWRTNPNTGEIRGASVYFNAGWIVSAAGFETDEGAVEDGTPAPSPNRTRPVLTWGGLSEQRLCEYDVASARRKKDGFDAAPMVASTSESALKLTKKQKFEKFLTHVVLHEIGHTLGLRHNFKGSILPPSSSTMDYLTDEDSFALDKPGAYDAEAIKYLYDMSDDQPKLPFCTDSDTVKDPSCNRFDSGADPLTEYFAPAYRSVLTDYLAGKTDPVTGATAAQPNNTLNVVLQYVRASRDPEQRAQALSVVFEGLKVGKVDATLAKTPGYAERVDAMSRKILRRAFLDDAAARGPFTADPAAGTAEYATFVTEARGNLLDSDNLRSYETRRSCVDIFKKFQTNEALAALTDAKAQMAAEQEALVDVTLKAQAADLAKRLDEATSPYFTK